MTAKDLAKRLRALRAKLPVTVARIARPAATKLLRELYPKEHVRTGKLRRWIRTKVSRGRDRRSAKLKIGAAPKAYYAKFHDFVFPDPSVFRPVIAAAVAPAITKLLENPPAKDAGGDKK